MDFYSFDIFYFQADIDLTKRAGELSEEEIEKIITIMQNPRQYKIPDWFLNRQKDIKDGKNGVATDSYFFIFLCLKVIWVTIENLPLTSYLCWWKGEEYTYI